VGTTSFSGNRRFVWFEPAKRRPTEYESYTVGQQSGPEQWLDVDWPVRFDDGRAPFVAESTTLRCERWGDYRDPGQTWQRPYVARHNHEEQALAMLIPEAMRDGLAETISPAWRNQVLGKYYAAWPFVEYGRFLCMCYVVREALSDTLNFAFAFQAADHLRHNQDIVHLLLELKEAVPGFTDEDARGAWMKDPILVPLRETIERIYGLTDWGEIVVALNLVVEPLAGTLMKSELMAHHAPHHGDAVTPMILAGVHHDSQRQLEATRAFVRQVCGDQAHGEANRATVRRWLREWTPHGERAAQALGGLFALPGLQTVPFPACYDRVVARQRAIVAELGL
jgi:methane monooxygenase component A beta chain/propane monooxygenase small subunit